MMNRGLLEAVGAKMMRKGSLEAVGLKMMGKESLEAADRMMKKKVRPGKECNSGMGRRERDEPDEKGQTARRNEDTLSNLRG